MRVIIATQNKGKFREIKELLKGISLPVVCLPDLKREFTIQENGITFSQNAIKKAQAVSKVYKEDYVIGEDSGLEVKALGNRPGVYSKRYAGRGATDLKNNRKLLKALQGIPFSQREAMFRCCLALVKKGRLLKIFEGHLKGLISKQMKGKRGFGYDPLFYLPRYKKTVAQLSAEEKNKISHRAKAFKKLKNYFS